jgi:uncharacterized membrane protein
MKKSKILIESSLKRNIRRRLFTGLLVILPIYVTFIIIKFMLGLIGGILSPLVRKVFLFFGFALRNSSVDEFVVTSVAFVTGSMKNNAGEELTSIFIPTTPNPTSGFLIYLPEEEILETNMTIEEGMKLIVSGGILIPEELDFLTKKSVRTADV